MVQKCQGERHSAPRTPRGMSCGTPGARRPCTDHEAPALHQLYGRVWAHCQPKPRAAQAHRWRAAQDVPLHCPHWQVDECPPPTGPSPGCAHLRLGEKEWAAKGTPQARGSSQAHHQHLCNKDHVAHLQMRASQPKEKVSSGLPLSGTAHTVYQHGGPRIRTDHRWS